MLLTTSDAVEASNENLIEKYKARLQHERTVSDLARAVAKQQRERAEQILMARGDESDE